MSRYLTEGLALARRRGPASRTLVARAFPAVPLTDEHVEALEAALSGEVPTVLRRGWEDAYDDLARPAAADGPRTLHAMAQIHPTATVATSAVVTGDVTVGAGSRILAGVVLHGTSARSASARTSSSWSTPCSGGASDHPVDVGDAVPGRPPHPPQRRGRSRTRSSSPPGVSMFPGSRAGSRVGAADPQRPPRPLPPRARHGPADRLDRRRRPRRSCSRRTATTSSGRSRRASTSPGPCGASRAGRRCARSCAGCRRPSARPGG